MFDLCFVPFTRAFYVESSMDQSGESPLAQQGAVSEADSPYSDQNQEFSVPGDVGEKSSTAFGDKSPGHVTREPGNLH